MSQSDVDHGIEAVRTKLMFDLQTTADRIKHAILGEGLEAELPMPIMPENCKAERPRNLRTKRAVCKEPNGTSGCGNVGGNGGGKSSKVETVKPNFSPLRTESKSSRLRGSIIDRIAAPSCEKRDGAKFSISLSRQEIEKVFMVMTGQRIPRRPKKRAKCVQKGLDMLFPGSWLTEVNSDIYEVPDVPDTGKR